MTNYKQARSNGKRGGNRTDGHRPDLRQTLAQRQAAEDRWEAAGFSRQWIREAARLTYTWPGIFPIFILTPGILTDGTGSYAGLIARYKPAGIEILFAYGSPPADIAERLNDEILAIMRHGADIDTPPPIVNGQEIGPEVPF